MGGLGAYGCEGEISVSTRSTRTNTRTRRVPPKAKRSPLLFFYILLGLIAVVIAIALVANLSRSATGSSTPFTPRALNAPVGRTADGFYYKGNPNAPVKVVEYADYQCPHCGEYAAQLEPTIDRQYVETGKIQMIYHEFPLPQFPYAMPAAEAARCAGDQGKYWPMHDLLFAKQSEWTGASNITNSLISYAGQLGLDRNTFTQCLSSGKWAAAITAARDAGTQAGVQATPTFAVDGKQVSSDMLQATIDAALKAKGK